MNKTLNNANRIKTIRIKINFRLKIFFISKFFNSTKLDNSLPINEQKNIRGMKPINVVIINLNFETFNIDKHRFWTIKGVPGINLNIIKYS